jgi:FeS assembly SUF system regulator
MRRAPSPQPVATRSLGLQLFRLSKITDYGIVLLAHLAKGANESAEPQNARELAEQVDLPAPVVSKVLKGLAREGVLESQRGAKGGYALARPPHRIHIIEIVDALEGAVAITECAAGPSLCSHEGTCAVRAPLTVLNGVVRDALRSVTLAELIDPNFGPLSASLTSSSNPLQILGRTNAPPEKLSK